MRKLRLLRQGVWYEVRTRINNREPLFRRRDALALFGRVFAQAKGRYEFVVRALCLEDDWLTFYILPADGFELPDIMKWLKQVFAQRFNGTDGRIGHVWGDRYWSEIVEGEPPEEENTGVRPLDEEGAAGVRPLDEEGAAGVRPLDEERAAGVRPLHKEGAIGVRPLDGEGTIGVRPLDGEGTIGVRPLDGEGTIGVRPLDGKMTETDRFLLFFHPNPPLPPHTVAPRPG